MEESIPIFYTFFYSFILYFLFLFCQKIQRIVLRQRQLGKLVNYYLISVIDLLLEDQTPQTVKQVPGLTAYRESVSGGGSVHR